VVHRFRARPQHVVEWPCYPAREGHGPRHDRKGRYGQTSIPSPSAPDRISYTLQDELFAASPPRRDAMLRRTLVDQEICSISLRKEN